MVGWHSLQGLEFFYVPSGAEPDSFFVDLKRAVADRLRRDPAGHSYDFTSKFLSYLPQLTGSSPQIVRIDIPAGTLQENGQGKTVPG